MSYVGRVCTFVNILISLGFNIHLLHAGEGNMTMYSPKSAINVLSHRMKPRKHMHVKHCWQTYFKSIGTLSQTFKNHYHNKWCVPSASDVFLSTNDNSGGKTRGGILFLFHGIWFMSCVITYSDFHPLSNQINLFMVINIWGIIMIFIFASDLKSFRTRSSFNNTQKRI